MPILGNTNEMHIRKIFYGFVGGRMHQRISDNLLKIITIKNT